MVIEPVSEIECREALAYVLALTPGNRLAPNTQIEAFQQYVETCHMEWRVWRCRRANNVTAYLVVLFLPGQTALFMCPPPEARGLDPEDQRFLVAEIVRLLADKELYFYQALLEPECASKRAVLEYAGFSPIARLIYTQRAVAVIGEMQDVSPSIRWIAYSTETHRDFAQILPATYEDSSDCPELSGLRPIEAVIASHKAAGEFDPALWELALVEDAPAACLLLAPQARGDLMEIVYLGVVRRWRRRGIGDALIRRALEQSRARGARDLTAVVDARNTPARQLYARFAFKPIAERAAYLLVPRPRSAAND